MSEQNSFVPNSFQTPNAYVDDYLSYLTGEETKVLTYATRRILGFQKRQDRISISQFTDGTKNSDGDVLDNGTGLSNETVRKCLASLVMFGLMVKVAPNDPKQNEGDLWSLQWNKSKVNIDAMQERSEKKAENQKTKMSKARSMRQTPPNGIERTPSNAIERTPPNGIETQKTEETQRKTEETFFEFEKLKAQHQEKGWAGREQFRDDHLLYADWWYSTSGQPAKGNKPQVRSCQKAFSDWQNQRLDIASLQQSYDARITWKKFIADPNELTKDAAAIQALPKAVASPAGPAINKKAIEATLEMLKEKEGKYVPMPEHLRQRTKAALEKMSDVAKNMFPERQTE